MNPGSELKLNVACGSNKIPGYINIDAEESNKPDQVIDILKVFPYNTDSVDEILFFHAIEHIPEKNHVQILQQFHRALKPNGYLYISYPEFTKVATNYINNYRGMRDFWKNTIYGLQRYPGDAHVALMDTKYFIQTLQECGFWNIEYKPEQNEPYNTILRCQKGLVPNNYEDLLTDLTKALQ